MNGFHWLVLVVSELVPLVILLQPIQVFLEGVWDLEFLLDVTDIDGLDVCEDTDDGGKDLVHLVVVDVDLHRGAGF